MHLNKHWNSHVHASALSCKTIKVGLHTRYVNNLMYVHDKLYSCFIRRAFWDHPHMSQSLFRANQHNQSHLYIIIASLYILYIQYADIIMIIILNCTETNKRWQKVEGFYSQYTLYIKCLRKHVFLCIFLSF